MTAKTSPMGWNSWDCWGAAVTEDIVRQNADYMAAHLKDFGWEYVVVDIQWYEPAADSHAYHPFTDLDMDEYSRLQPAVKIDRSDHRFKCIRQDRGTLSAAGMLLALAKQEKFSQPDFQCKFVQ